MGKDDKSQTDLLEAVVVLRPAGNAAADIRSAAASLLERAEAETGIHADATHIMGNLHSFSVRAPKRLIDALAHADEVAQVLHNELSGSPLIPPTDRRSIDLPD